MSDKLEFLDGPEPAEGETVSGPAADASGGVRAPDSAPTDHAPISALLDERDKRKAAQERAAALEQRLAEVAAAQASREPPPLDQQMFEQVYTLRRDMSRDLMVQARGEDLAQRLEDWGAAKCDVDRVFNQQVFQSKNPYEFIRQAYDREQILAQVKPDDLAAFKAWQAAQATAGSPSPAPAAAPPRSLATASGTGGAGQPHVPIGPGAAFASAINR